MKLWLWDKIKPISSVRGIRGMRKLVHELPSITLSRVLMAIFKNWNSRVGRLTQCPTWSLTLSWQDNLGQISKCASVENCYPQKNWWFPTRCSIKAKQWEGGGGVCVCVSLWVGKYAGVLCAASKATLARTGGKRSASDSTHRSAAAAVGISRSQVSSPASVTDWLLPPDFCSYCLTTVKAGQSHSSRDRLTWLMWHLWEVIWVEVRKQQRPGFHILVSKTLELFGHTFFEFPVAPSSEPPAGWSSRSACTSFTCMSCRKILQTQLFKSFHVCCFTQITPVQTNPQLVYPHLDWDLKLPRPDIQHPALGLETDGILLVLQHFVETHIGHQVDVVRVDKGQPLHNTQ